MNWLRSIIAVALGYAVMALGVLLYFRWTAVEPLANGLTPPVPTGNERLVVLGVSFAAAALGGLVCALLAPGARYRHLRFLAALVAVMAVVSALISSSGSQSLIFQLAQAALAVAGVFVGGSLKRGSRL